MAINKRLIRTNDESGVGASFNTLVFTDNGTETTQEITGLGFQPDLIWTKARFSDQRHYIYDSVRGTYDYLSSNETFEEQNRTFGVEGIADGIRKIGNVWSRTQTDGIVAWCWKAGGAAVTNTDGTITSQVSANTEAGFSIVKFTGINLSANTIGHGLGVTPSLVIMKGTNVATEWRVYSDELASDAFLKLNETSAAVNIGINKTWTSTTISQQWAPATYDWIAYCFAEVAGFSKFGSYVGNGSTNGPTITTGFRPLFIMVKASTVADNWTIWDNVRDTGDNIDQILVPNTSGAETADGFGRYDITLSDTGFQIKRTDGQINANGQTYIYMAFANQF